DQNLFNIYSGTPESNGEAQYYTGDAQNLHVQNGSLWLSAINHAYGGFNYTPAPLVTLHKEKILYGQPIVPAQVPTEIGTWPAIWMLASDHKYAGQSPASDINRYLNDGEIDILESVGTQPHTVYGVAHSLAYPEDGLDRSYYNTIYLWDNDRVFHDYEVDWA